METIYSLVKNKAKKLNSISCPSRLDLHQAIQFSNSIALLPQQDEYIFDFSSFSWAYPFGMLFTAQAIKNLRQRYPEAQISLKSLNAQAATSYAAYMGYFTSCGFSIGNAPNFKASTSTYIPITYAQVNQLQPTSELEALSRELAKQLTQLSSGALVDALEYSFREIIRNVIEHSNSKVLGYCAQYWPKKDLVELAILDTGMGLKKSLSQNPHLTLREDQDVIKYALMPGISGKTYKGVKIRPDDAWQNSGYGLYMNYRLCNEGGNFFICSGSKGLYRAKDNDNNQYYGTNFQGTALRLQMNTQNLKDVKSMLKQFTEDGEAIAREIGMGSIPTASTMSKMLRENFKFMINLGDTIKHKQYGKGIVEGKQITPQGEILRVVFGESRYKKVPVTDVIKLNGNQSEIEDHFADEFIDLASFEASDFVADIDDFDDLFNEQ